MNATGYWLLARKYPIWNATAATLQIWTADLEPNVLSSTIEQVYTTLFYTTSMHLLCNQPEEVLFGCFMTTLNDAFKRELALADEGYESGSETSNLPTPLQRTSRIHHISSNENISFDPSTACTTATSQSNHKPVCHHLSFSSSDNEDISSVHSSSHISTSLPLHSMCFDKSPAKSTYTICDDLEEEEEEQDFQTVTLDDHWITDPVPDRHLCIHEQDTLDLSDISDFKDVMTTSRDKDIPALDDVIGL